MSTLYRAQPNRSFGVGRGETILLLPEEGRTVLIPSNVAQLMQLMPHLGRPRTLEAHAAHLRTHVRTFRDDESARQVLRALVEARVLVADPDMLVAPHPPTTTFNGLVEAVGIPTADRPMHLARCLGSLAATLVRTRRRPEVLVIDDSRREGARERVARIVPFARRHGISLRYANRDRRRRFCAELASHELEREVLEYALLGDPEVGGSIGATRNTILIDAVTLPSVMMMDDDMVSVGVGQPGGATGVALYGHGDPTETWFFEDRGALLQSRRPGKIDLLSSHERLLGRTIADLVAAGGGVRVDDSICEHVMPAVQHEQGRVVLTIAGVVGDSGLHSNVGFLFAIGDTRRRLAASEADYRVALRAREVLRVAPTATVAHESVCGAGNIAIDATAAIPFFPNFRSEDRVFGGMLARCMRDGYIGHVPLALFHAAAGARGSVPYTVALGVVRVADVVLAMLDTIVMPESIEAPSARLVFIGRELSHLGGLSPTEFRARLLAATLRRYAMVLVNVQAAAEAEDRPARWRDDLTEVRARLLVRVTEPDFVVPVDAGPGSADDRLRHTQRALLRFGHLCERWPTFLDAARDAARSGLRVTE